MTDFPEGNAIVYCEGAFGTTNGKTAHGLVRRSRRYRILSVVDSRHAGEDAGMLLGGVRAGIPVVGTIRTALDLSKQKRSNATHLVVGLAPDGGRLTGGVRNDILYAIQSGLNVDSGLHDLLSEDPEILDLAERAGLNIRDIRSIPHRKSLHFFTGRISEVKSQKVAVLGTDSAVGKRTTAWLLVDSLLSAGRSAVMVGTGQTAWMQGAKYGFIMDVMINDFLSGEIEHAIWTAWKKETPDVIVIEGQGGLLNPAYPGGYEILAAGRPDEVILQHAPGRREYDGFPGYPIHPLERQVRAVEAISGKTVAAITLNHEGMQPSEVETVRAEIEKNLGIPAYDVLLQGGEDLAARILSLGREGTC